MLSVNTDLTRAVLGGGEIGLKLGHISDHIKNTAEIVWRCAFILLNETICNDTFNLKNHNRKCHLVQHFQLRASCY